MFYREINPEAYTINGEHGSQQYMHPESATLGGQIVTLCDDYNFAVIRNTFAEDDFNVLRKEAAQTIVEHDGAGWTQRINDRRARGVHKTWEDMTTLPETSQDLLQGIAHAIYRASASSRIMDTQDDTINRAFVARYAPKASVGMHYDECSGIVLDTALEGRGVMRVACGIRGVAQIVLEPNVTVVMPAQTYGSRGAADQAKHSVRNCTLRSAHNGYRLSVVYSFGGSAA